jgi:hypothetical protein
MLSPFLCLQRDKKPNKNEDKIMADNSGIDKLKGTTPSKLGQGVIDQSWLGGTPNGTTDPKKVLADKFTAPKHQVKP